MSDLSVASGYFKAVFDIAVISINAEISGELRDEKIDANSKVKISYDGNFP